MTRRCVERRFFLTPDAKNGARLNNFIGYALGVCLERYGISLHAFNALSTHIHQSLTDLFGSLPAFKTTLHAWIARGVNALRGRSDRFWSADQPVDVRAGEQLPDDEHNVDSESALDDLVYTLINPVKDGASRNGGRWPGFSTYGWRFGETRTFKRPDWFFDPQNPELPDEVSITLERPKDVLPELSDDEVYDRLMEKVRSREREIQAQMRTNNRRFMGEAKIRKQHWNRTSRSFEERFTTAKRLHERKTTRRVKALDRERRWRAEYAEARERYRSGESGVVFPFGTYWVARFAGARVANAPP